MLPAEAPLRPSQTDNGARGNEYAGTSPLRLFDQIIPIEKSAHGIDDHVFSSGETFMANRLHGISARGFHYDVRFLRHARQIRHARRIFKTSQKIFHFFDRPRHGDRYINGYFSFIHRLHHGLAYDAQTHDPEFHDTLHEETEVIVMTLTDIPCPIKRRLMALSTTLKPE